MAEWRTTKLGQISQIYSGFAFRSQDLGSRGIPVLKIANIQNKRVSSDCSDHLPEELCTDKLNRYFLHPDDTLIAMTGAGSVGKVGKMPHTTGRFLVNQRVAIVRPDASRCDPAFVYFALSQDYYEAKLYGLGLGAGQPNVSAKQIGELEIPVPTLPMQRRIASILLAYDELIENNQRRIKILEEMARSLYREWFVHFRFPGHEKVKMAPSALGQIPQGWEVRKLSEFVSTQYGYTESTNAEPVGPKYLRGMDINKTSYINWFEVPYCPIKQEDQPSYSLKVGDVVVIRMADPGKVGIVEQDVKAVFASYLIRVRPKDDYLRPYFLFHLLGSPAYQGYISGAATGTTRKSASAGVITDYQVALPPKELIAAFEERVASFRELLTTILNQTVNLRRTRDLLLPRLLSGQINLRLTESVT